MLLKSTVNLSRNCTIPKSVLSNKKAYIVLSCVRCQDFVTTLEITSTACVCVCVGGVQGCISFPSRVLNEPYSLVLPIQ